MTSHSLRRVLALSALAAMLVTAAWVVNVAAAAADTDACYEQVGYVERIYEQPTYVTEHQVAKHTRTRTKTVRGWSDWSAPEAWSPLSHVAWLAEVPAPTWAPHASGHGWVREWAVLPTGTTRQVEAGTESSGWTRDELAAPWVLVDRRDGTEDGDQVPCEQQPPAEQREDVVVDCESGVVTTRTFETPFVLVGFEWEPGVEVLVASSQREAGEECPTPTTLPPTTVPPTTVPPLVCPTGDEGINAGVDPSVYPECPPLHSDTPAPTTVPADPAVEIVAAQPAVGELPDTGAGQVIGLAVLGAVMVTAGYFLIRTNPKEQ